MDISWSTNFPKAQKTYLFILAFNQISIFVGGTPAFMILIMNAGEKQIKI